LSNRGRGWPKRATAIGARAIFDLDGICCAREGNQMQIRPLIAAAASAALLALAGCNNQPEVVNSTVDRNPPPPLRPEELPPSQTASKTYRCSDNSLFYVEFYSNNSAMVRRGTRAAPPVRAVAEGGNPPYVGEGVSVSGNGDNVTINGKSCHT
jgi:hypothetical protein